MQNYLWRKLESSLFTGRTGKIMRQNQASFTLACYLICCQQSNDIGIFRFEPDIECTRMGMTPEQCESALKTCIDAGFCQFDHEQDIIFIPNFTKIQIGTLKEKDHRRRGLHKTLKSIPDHQFTKDWIAKYKDIYGQPVDQEQAPSKPLPSPLQAPSKGGESPSQAPRKPLEVAKNDEPKEDDTPPGAHVMGQMTAQQLAEAEAKQAADLAKMEAEAEQKRKDRIASFEAKKNQAPSKPLESPSKAPLKDLISSFEDPLKDLASPSQAPSKDLLTREETETETETETEDFSKEKSDNKLQTGNQPGGDLLAGAPVLPSGNAEQGNPAKVLAQFARLGIPGESQVDDGFAGEMARATGRTLPQLAAALSAVEVMYDPFSADATPTKHLSAWQAWLMHQVPRMSQ